MMFETELLPMRLRVSCPWLSITAAFVMCPQILGVVYSASDTPIDIPDSPAAGIASNINVPPPDDGVSSVRLNVNISHTYRGDLSITLSDPSGRDFIVRNPDGDPAENLVIAGLFVPTQNVDVFGGIWTLKVRDTVGGDRGTLLSWSLDFQFGGGGSILAQYLPEIVFSLFPIDAASPSVIGFYESAGRYNGHIIFRRDSRKRIIGVKALGISIRHALGFGTFEHHAIEMYFDARGYPSKLFCSDGTAVTLRKLKDGSVRVKGVNAIGDRVLHRTAEPDVALTFAVSELSNLLKTLRDFDFSVPDPDEALVRLREAALNSDADARLKVAQVISLTCKVGTVTTGIVATGVAIGAGAPVAAVVAGATTVLSIADMVCLASEADKNLCRKVRTGGDFSTALELGQHVESAANKIATPGARWRTWAKQRFLKEGGVFSLGFDFCSRAADWYAETHTQPPPEIRTLGDAVSYSGGADEHRAIWIPPPGSALSPILSYDMLGIPDRITIYDDTGSVLYSSGLVSGSSAVEVPNVSMYIIIVNEGGSDESATSWSYTFGAYSL